MIAKRSAGRPLNERQGQDIPRRNWSLFTFVLLALLGGNASPARAAWPVDTPFPSGAYTTDVTVAPDHRVGLLGGCSTSPQEPLTDLSPTGDTLWTIPAAGDLATVDSCIAPFYDHDANAYLTGNDSSGNHHLVSYDAAGHLRWSTPILYGLNRNYTRSFFDLQSANPPPPYPPGPGDIAQGADGNIYLLDGADLGYSIGLQIHLRSFNARTGAPVLDINLETPGQGQAYPGALLQPTSTGVLVGTNTGARFYSYDGQLQWDQAYWGGNTGIPGLGIRDRTPDGGFLAVNNYAATGQCSSPSNDPAQVVSRIDKVTASGLAWSVTVPTSGTTGTCLDLIEPLRIHGAPDGGAILVESPRYGAGRQTLTGIGPDGKVRWALPTDTDAIEDVRVGGDGTAVVIEHGTRHCGPPGEVPQYTCGTLVLHFISATTGSATRPDVVIATPDPSAAKLASSGRGVVPVIPELLNAQADTDRLLIAYASTADPADPNAEFVRVDAIPVPGLGPDVSFNADPAIATGGGGTNPPPPPPPAPADLTVSLIGPAGLSAGQVGMVTAHVDNHAGVPAVGLRVSFGVSGVNGGAVGECEPNVSCLSDGAGFAGYAYRSTHPGTDAVIAWIDLNGDGRPSAGEPQASTTVSWTPPPGNTAYVAMGDSFSAGEGLGKPYLAGTDHNFRPAENDCHRNSGAYGPLLSRAVGLRGLGSLTFVACSGAETDDLVHPNVNNAGEPAQIDRVGPATKTITLTIGGNDLGFKSILARCIYGRGTTDGASGCANDLPFRQKLDERLGVLVGARSDTTRGGRKIQTPEGRKIWSIPALISKIARRAPGAHIYLGGYPQLFGDTGLSESDLGYCIVGHSLVGEFRIANADVQWIRSLITLANSDIRQVAKAANTAARAHRSGIRVTYADPAAVFAGHGLCDYAGQSWINGLLLTSGAAPTKAESFHPNVRGQKDGYYEAFRETGIGH